MRRRTTAFRWDDSVSAPDQEDPLSIQVRELVHEEKWRILVRSVFPLPLMLCTGSRMTCLGGLTAQLDPRLLRWNRLRVDKPIGELNPIKRPNHGIKEVREEIPLRCSVLLLLLKPVKPLPQLHKSIVPE